MIGVAFNSDELFVFDVKHHGTGVWAIMRATPMIGLNCAVF
jgi:hypothetical protein